MQVSRSPGGDDGLLWPPGVGGSDAPPAPKRQRREADAPSETTRPGARCGTCRPCRLERDTPCATTEVRAAAAAGHVGAALTLQGAAALGGVVSVFWPAEGCCFVGRLAAFNPLEPAFLVLYTDGEWHWESLRSSLVQALPASTRTPRPPPMPRAAQQRLQAAARRGSTGAALALMGQAAVGYVLDVAAGPRWGWMRAQVVSFEPRTHAHLLYYPGSSEEEWARLDRTTVRPALPAAAEAEPPLPPAVAAAADALGLDGDWADDALLSCLYAADGGLLAGDTTSV